MSEKPMTNQRAIRALNDAIAVLEKLEEAGVEKPLESLTPKGK